MKIKRFVAGLSAAVLAATMMSVSVSAAKLGDVVHPSEEDSKMNDSYYSIGAMGFYMGQDWTWNQGDWVGIDDAGKITVEYKISKVVTDKTMSGKGTLGDMGVMVANLPDGVYPVDVKISDAKFVAEDGESKTDASKADSKSDASSSKADTSKKDASSSKADAGKTSAAAATSSKASDDTSKAAETGAAVGGAFAVIALAGTAVIVAKRRK